MKPCNFPARANERRLSALSRMRAHDLDLIAATQANIVPNARDIRTKKDRTTSARFGRA